MTIIECYCCINKHKPYLTGNLQTWIPSDSVGLCKKCQPRKSIRGVKYDHWPLNKNGTFKKRLKRQVVVKKKKKRDHLMTAGEKQAYKRGYNRGVRFVLKHGKISL